MYQTLAAPRGPTATIHLEDWFHPASQSVWITWLDDDVCDRLARRWLEASAEVELRGEPDCDNQVDLYRLRMPPTRRVTCHHVMPKRRYRRTTVPGRRERSGRLVPSSYNRVWADVTRLVLELHCELARLRRRVRSSLTAAKR